MTLDEHKLYNYFKKINRGFMQCEDCFNKHHCAKGCPSVCPLVMPYTHIFDCTAEKIISKALMQEKQDDALSIAHINELIRNYKEI
ncbi:MAG: hypothetical protein R2861_03670 [Desulfobacterales bacterium]